MSRAWRQELHRRVLRSAALWRMHKRVCVCRRDRPRLLRGQLRWGRRHLLPEPEPLHDRDLPAVLRRLRRHHLLVAALLALVALGCSGEVQTAPAPAARFPGADTTPGV